MVYGVVALTLLCLTVKGYSGKRTSGYVKDATDSVRFSLLRMIFCMLIGGALLLLEGAGKFLKIETGMLGICLLAGISNALFLVCWLSAVRKNSMVSMDVGMTLGSLLPAVFCAALFGEELSPWKMLGFAMIVAATVILAKPGNGQKGRGFGAILLLILAAVGDGMTGVVQQLYRQYYTEAGDFTHGVFYPKSIYHFYTYVFTSAALLAALAVCHLIQKRNSKKTVWRVRDAMPLRVVLHVLVMAVCLFAANYLQTVATNNFGMPSQVLYPVLKGGCLITVNFVAMIFFGEKITRRGVLGSSVALCGIVCINLL